MSIIPIQKIILFIIFMDADRTKIKEPKKKKEGSFMKKDYFLVLLIIIGILFVETKDALSDCIPGIHNGTDSDNTEGSDRPWAPSGFTTQLSQYEAGTNKIWAKTTGLVWDSAHALEIHNRLNIFPCFHKYSHEVKEDTSVSKNVNAIPPPDGVIKSPNIISWSWDADDDNLDGRAEESEFTVLDVNFPVANEIYEISLKFQNVGNGSGRGTFSSQLSTKFPGTEYNAFHWDKLQTRNYAAPPTTSLAESIQDTNGSSEIPSFINILIPPDFIPIVFLLNIFKILKLL